MSYQVGAHQEIMELFTEPRKYCCTGFHRGLGSVSLICSQYKITVSRRAEGKQAVDQNIIDYF